MHELYFGNIERKIERECGNILLRIQMAKKTIKYRRLESDNIA